MGVQGVLRRSVKQNLPGVWACARWLRYDLPGVIDVAPWYIRKSRFGIEAIRNYVIDRRYGGYCGGRIATRFAHTGAHGVSSADYYQLKKLFTPPQGVAIRDDDVIVEIGSGKGRVINFWLHQGYRNRIIGIELDPDHAAYAARRLAKYPSITIIPGNALEHLPANGTLFYLFNPFNSDVMEALKRRMIEKYRGRRDVRIVYYYPTCLDVFRNDPAWNVIMLPARMFYGAALITMKPERAL